MINITMTAIIVIIITSVTEEKSVQAQRDIDLSQEDAQVLNYS